MRETSANIHTHILAIVDNQDTFCCMYTHTHAHTQHCLCGKYILIFFLFVFSCFFFFFIHPAVQSVYCFSSTHLSTHKFNLTGNHIGWDNKNSMVWTQYIKENCSGWACNLVLLIFLLLKTKNEPVAVKIKTMIYLPLIKD